MLLSNFLTKAEERMADAQVRDLLAQRKWGQQQAEFLGHFLSSVFQPVVSSIGNRLETVGYEAFVRPRAGDEIIAVEDYFTAIEPDNQAHVDMLCRHLHTANFLSQAFEDELLFLNMETAAIAENPQELANLISQLHSTAEQGLELHRVVLEIDLTPHLDPGELYTFVTAIRETGVKIALERFDADSASLARVVQIRPDIVKFNRSWLDADLHDRSYAAMVAQMVTSVEALGAQTHQEFIESGDELRFASACGFSFLQGFAIEEPQPALVPVSIDLLQR